MTSSTYLVAGIGSTVNLIRLAADIIACATARTVDKPITEHLQSFNDEEGEVDTVGNSVDVFGSASSVGPLFPSVRSTSEDSRRKHVHFDDSIRSRDSGSGFGAIESEDKTLTTPLLSRTEVLDIPENENITLDQLDDTLDRAQHPSSEDVLHSRQHSRQLYQQLWCSSFWFITLAINVIVFVYLVLACVLNSLKIEYFKDAQYNAIPLGATSVGTFVGITMHIRDKNRQRFNRLQRILGTTSVLILCKLNLLSFYFLTLV